MQLLVLALATLGSEDLACAAAGALIARGQIGFSAGLIACLIGIAAGDLLLYLAGRFLGRPIVRRLTTRHQIDQASAWISARGAKVVLISRFTPGLRLPTYVAAGVLRTPFARFAVYFLLAAAIWTPLLVGASAYLGRTLPLHQAGFVLLGVLTLPRIPWRRLARWEFWPVWMAYLPLVPWWIWLALRYRSFTVFMQANPGIPYGGIKGESKSAILAHLPWVPRYEVVKPGERFAPDRYPVVCKPDIGERGRGVAIVRNAEELGAYLDAADELTIVQEYAEGEEFGVYYYRFPHEPGGRIFSITKKVFPAVIGDGRHSIAELIDRDSRAARIASTYLAQIDGRRVPSEGERVPLVEIGAHCRGTIFLNGAGLETPQLRRAIDYAARCVPGFYFGRFDVRAESAQALQEGRFRILELNGVTAEPAHIYDPAVGVGEAYRTMARQWELAFAIGQANRERLPGPDPDAAGTDAYDVHAAAAGVRYEEIHLGDSGDLAYRSTDKCRLLDLRVHADRREEARRDERREVQSTVG